MRFFRLPVLYLLINVCAACAQQAPTGRTVKAVPNAPANAITTIKSEVRFVQVDVIANDAYGQPVAGLKQDDFTLLEDKQPQPIASFTFESSLSSAAPANARDKLPEHVFSNRPQTIRAPAPLNIILLDALNTGPKDYMFAKSKLASFLSTRSDQSPTALFLLSNGLHLVSDFTTDKQAVLQQANRTILRSGNVPGSVDPVFQSNLPNPKRAVTAQLAELYAAVASFLQDQEAQRAIDFTTDRAQRTLAALESIARAVQSYPGRKRLLWISSSFPFVITPQQIGATRADSSDIRAGLRSLDIDTSFGSRVRVTTTKLAEAKVAVYPIDARGLAGSDFARAEERAHGNLAHEIDRASSELFQSHGTMFEIAENTGGLAFINRNDLDQAMAISTGDGNSFYTIGYYPRNKDWDGRFRHIQVKVDHPGVQLRYRQGYFATEPALRQQDDRARVAEIKYLLGTKQVHATAVSFLARVTPPPPASSLADVKIEFLVDAPTLQCDSGSDGSYSCDIGFYVQVFDKDGKSEHFDGKLADVKLPQDTYEFILKNGLAYNMQMKLPPGNYDVHLLVRDNKTGSMGTLTAPLVVEAPIAPPSSSGRAAPIPTPAPAAKDRRSR